ncbi:hypothetical protein ACS0TY_001772 [Phlomoides rotata]
MELMQILSKMSSSKHVPPTSSLPSLKTPKLELGDDLLTVQLLDQTSLQAHPPKIKTSEELEKVELENIPQFKARPLNKKIFESKGMGIFSNMKKQVTIAQEFNCVVDKRTPPPTTVVDLFDMLSICSESHHEKPPLPRLTTPNPFHLHTDRRLVEELLQKQVEEERARVSKAHVNIKVHRCFH